MPKLAVRRRNVPSSRQRGAPATVSPQHLLRDQKDVAAALLDRLAHIPLTALQMYVMYVFAVGVLLNGSMEIVLLQQPKTPAAATNGDC